MTDKRAAEILRAIAQKNLPTVDGIPFVEISEALRRGADALEPKKSITEVLDDIETKLMRGGL